MAQIQTYPRKTTYDANDLILICDKTPDANGVVTNDTKTTTISTIADNLNVVETLNSLKGDVSITGGTGIGVAASGSTISLTNTGVTSLVGGSNIDISGSTGAITISTSASNVDGSGTAGTIPKWSDSNTLTDSIIKDQGGEDIIIPRFIKHDGDLNNAFGFNATGEFLVSVGPSTDDQFSVAADAIIMKTDSGTKLAAGPTGLAFYNDENGSTTVSKLSAGTYDSGLFVKGGTENEFSRGGGVRFYTSTNDSYVGISGPTTNGTTYEVVLPNAVGTASQVLKLPSTIGTSPYQLVWGDAGSGSGTGGFETLPFTTANGYITATGTYIFQMIAPSNCAPANFKFYNFLAQSADKKVAVAIYKGDIDAGGSLQSTGEIEGVLGSSKISGSTLTVADEATAISAGDDILVCLSFDSNISPLGVIPITASGSITLTNASPVSNDKLALFDSTSVGAAQFPATISGLLTLLSERVVTTTKPFLLIY